MTKMLPLRSLLVFLLSRLIFGVEVEVEVDVDVDTGASATERVCSGVVENGSRGDESGDNSGENSCAALDGHSEGFLNAWNSENPFNLRANVYQAAVWMGCDDYYEPSNDATSPPFRTDQDYQLLVEAYNYSMRKHGHIEIGKTFGTITVSDYKPTAFKVPVGVKRTEYHGGGRGVYSKAKLKKG